MLFLFQHLPQNAISSGQSQLGVKFPAGLIARQCSVVLNRTFVVKIFCRCFSCQKDSCWIVGVSGRVLLDSLKRIGTFLIKSNDCLTKRPISLRRPGKSHDDQANPSDQKQSEGIACNDFKSIVTVHSTRLLAEQCHGSIPNFAADF